MFHFFVSYPIEFWFPMQIKSLASPLSQPHFSYLANLFGDDRREVYRILQEEGIDLPRYAVLNRDPACPEGEYLAVFDCSLLDIHDLTRYLSFKHLPYVWVYVSVWAFDCWMINRAFDLLYRYHHI